MNKIILADHQTIFRVGVAKVLASEEDMRIIAQCSDCERLYDLIGAFRRALLLFSTMLQPDLHVLAERLKHAGSRAVAILENNQSAKAFHSPAVSGLVYRNATGADLIACVRRVASGERFEQILHLPVAVNEEDQVGARVRDRLTPNEMKIVGLLVQGKRNKEIASYIGTTEQVIKNYLRCIFDKTGVSDRLELALFTVHHKTLAEAAEAAGNLIACGN